MLLGHFSVMGGGQNGCRNQTAQECGKMITEAAGGKESFKQPPRKLKEMEIKCGGQWGGAEPQHEGGRTGRGRRQ